MSSKDERGNALLPSCQYLCFFLSQFPSHGEILCGVSVMDACEDIERRLLNVFFICEMERRTYIAGYTEVEGETLGGR